MHREEKEITDEAEINAIVRRSDICRLAMADEAGPYIVPLNFGFSDNALYFHSAHKGRKIDILRQNPRVCFEFDVDVEIVSAEKACKWGPVLKASSDSGRPIS